jgi:uncharacterized membrane protein YphA (DoxX/SURF4 family)
MKILTWVLVGLLAIFLIFMGAQKLMGPNPVFSYIAETTGIGLFEPLVRILTGLAEIAAAILLVLPKMRMKGAMLALFVLGGALLFHISPFLGIVAPVAFAEEGSVDKYIKSPMLFYMASSFFVAVLALIFVERVQIDPAKT